MLRGSFVLTRLSLYPFPLIVKKNQELKIKLDSALPYLHLIFRIQLAQGDSLP